MAEETNPSAEAGENVPAFFDAAKADEPATPPAPPAGQVVNVSAAQPPRGLSIAQKRKLAERKAAEAAGVRVKRGLPAGVTVQERTVSLADGSLKPMAAADQPAVIQQKAAAAAK